jgi:hypothetical protein
LFQRVSWEDDPQTSQETLNRTCKCREEHSSNTQCPMRLKGLTTRNFQNFRTEFPCLKIPEYSRARVRRAPIRRARVRRAPVFRFAFRSLLTRHRDASACTRQHAHVSFITHEPKLFGLAKIKTYLFQDPHNRAVSISTPNRGK